MSRIESVSMLSIVFMAVTAVLALLVPIAAVIFMGVKKRLNWKALLFGALLFVVFALVLERILHMLVLGSNPIQSAIYQKPALYVLYGGFAAGIFEETARLLGFKFLIRVRENESLDTGISYGLGHGGIEAVLLGGLAAISNLVTSVMLNAGLLKGMTATMNAQQLETFNQGINSLVSLPSHMFLISGVERMIALVLQVALSVFVLKAVVEKKWLYFAYAILIHAGVDMIAVLYQRGYIFKDIFLMEGIILLITIAVAFAAFKIYKRKVPEPAGQVSPE